MLSLSVLSVYLTLSFTQLPLWTCAQTTAPVLPLSSFAYPPASSRPKFRYWLPDASVPASAVQSDVSEIAKVSEGGLEFLGFYNYGFGPMSTDWSLYGFGTAKFKEVFKAALDTAAKYGLALDFAIGPATGAGVPAIPQTAGLAMELVYGTKLLSALETAGSLPRPVLDFNRGFLNGWVHEAENWGPSELVAVVAAKVGSRQKTGKSFPAEQVVLTEANVLDLTNLTRNETLDWRAPASKNDSQPWILMAFYQRYSNERACDSAPNPSSWIGNGSWMVDHFSAAGAKKATDFWDQHILDDSNISQLVDKVGSYSWEDSMEMMASLWWTPDFLTRFEKSRGYSAVRYLPFFFQAKNLWNSYGAPYNTSFMLSGQAADGGKYAEDYRLTLNEGYQDFLRHCQQWASGRGLQHSAQPAYNMPLDMSSAIPLLGAPELESLGFGESIDSYLQFTGPAHLSGRTNSISTEIGAERGGAYAETVPVLLKLFHDSFAAGVNTLVIHGFPYGGPYPGTTWPGYTPFQYEFSEMWGPRQPAWRHFNDTLLYAARNCEVLKTGVPRVDIAFYSWKQPFTAATVFPGGAELAAAGYTYEYLGPENLASTPAYVTDSVLAKDGPAYKAIVLYQQTRITPLASAALLNFAGQGLPILIVGSTPNITIGSTGQDIVSKNMATLTSGGFPSVKVIPPARFSSERLQEAGILPRTVPGVADGPANATSQLVTQWRSDSKKGLELVYLLNRGVKATFDISFAVGENAVPFVLDAWTGEQTHLLTYLRTREGISTRITLSQQQSAIFAFMALNTTEQADVPLYVVSRSANIGRLKVNLHGQIEGLIGDTDETSALLSNNNQVDVLSISNPGSTPAPLPTVKLGPWKLTLEEYAGPAKLSTSSVLTNMSTNSIASPLKTLVPWTQIPGIQHSSGVGTYQTTFSLPSATNITGGLSNGTGSMAYTLHFSGRVINTMRVRVNGVILPAIDPSAPDEGREITDLVKGDGTDELTVEVSSTLFNAVKARAGDVKSIGLGIHIPKDYAQVGWKDFGLLGEVTIQSWRKVVLK
ncbi:hypothetical protein B0T22DRAFT_383697 [Podospora appendiculata]|uniref:Secreted protein n=1 Tax=Podospora appendiculata TaxID=314037 RepID=A0AAE0X3P9_9PEZI|nr:hypothetical protein B0T22DRAFT_383697 [Podospora appendiculata]